MSYPGPKNKIIVPSGIVIWLDVDDCLVDFHRHFNTYLRKQGYDIPKDYKPQKYSYAELMPEKEFLKHFNDLGDHWPAKVRALAGAAEFTRRLSEMGCRVILITSVNGHQGPERIQNLVKHHIYFDEIYLTKGRQKSEFASWLSTRYVDSRGKQVRSILIDDYAKNSIEFIKMVPNSVSVTMDVGYSKEWIEKIKGKKSSKKIVVTPKNAEEMYEETFKMIAKLLTRHGKKRSKKKNN